MPNSTINRQKTAPVKTSPSVLRRFIPMMLLGVVVLIFFASGLYQRLSLDELALQYGELRAFIEANFWLSVLATCAVYLGATAASFPAAWLLTVAIGLVFGWSVGAAIVVVGATLGASILYFAARSLFVDFFRKRAGEKLNVMARGFCENGVSYMLFLRLAPIFPFIMVNVVPAILGVRFSVFFWTTAFGIIPGTIAYAFAGEGLRSIIHERAIACSEQVAPCGQPLSASDIITPQMLVAFTLLALVSLIPVVLKHFRKAKTV